MTQDALPGQRRRALERVRYEQRDRRTILIVGPMLGLFGAFLAWQGAANGMWVAILGLAVLISAVGWVQRRRGQRQLRAAMQGELVSAAVLRISRKPGSDAHPDEYSLCLLPHGGTEIWLRARIPPAEAERLFGQLPERQVPLHPDDLRLPVFVVPGEPDAVALAV